MAALFWISLAAHIAGAPAVWAAEQKAAASPQQSEDSDAQILSLLLTDYEAYGLPLPPENAELITTRRESGTHNGVKQFSNDILFRETRDKQKLVWVGCEPVEGWSKPEGVEIVRESTPDVIARVESAETQFHAEGFPTYPYLALAVQCRSRGWNALSRALLKRSRQPDLRSRFGNARLRPKDDRVALAAVAWNYWCDEFARSKGDRKVVIAHLSKLRDSGLGLDARERQHVIDDMEQTLAPSKSPPGSLEEAIGSLIDMGIEGGWRGGRFADLQTGMARHAGCRKLRNAGLDAVPTLIEHLSDFRMTRCIEHSRRGAFHARIADVVAVLLNGLVKEEFSYDVLTDEGRGKRLDQAHVLHWWASVRDADALEYLRSNAVVKDETGKYTANGAMLHALGQRYPDELLKVFEDRLNEMEHAHALFEALGNSRAADEAKARLLLAAAGNADFSKRDFAIRQLFKLKHPQAAPLLVKELDALPKKPTQAYWLCGAGQVASLVGYTDDERVWAALDRAAKRVDLGQKMEVLQAIGNCRGSDRAIKFLSGFLLDTEVRTINSGIPDLSKFLDPQDAIEAIESDPFSGPAAGFVWNKLAVRDFAALQLANQLGMDENPPASWTEEDWAGLRARVERALAERNSGKRREGADK